MAGGSEWLCVILSICVEKSLQVVFVVVIFLLRGSNLRHFTDPQNPPPNRNQTIKTATKSKEPNTTSYIPLIPSHSPKWDQNNRNPGIIRPGKCGTLRIPLTRLPSVSVWPIYAAQAGAAPSGLSLRGTCPHTGRLFPAFMPIPLCRRRKSACSLLGAAVVQPASSPWRRAAARSSPFSSA